MGLFFWNGMRAQCHITILLLLATVASAVQADDVGIVVERIIVSGNKVTDERVIVRELFHRVGHEFDPAFLAFERDRVYSLGLFNRVEVYHSVHDGKATIYVDVHERWYIFPLPIFGIKDRDWDKLYYGLGVLHNNFRGRNEKLWGGFALGYDPWVSILYNNPSFLALEHIFFETQFIYTLTENRSLIHAEDLRNFDETRYMFDVTFGRRFSLFSMLTLTLGYRAISTTDYIPGHTKSPDGSDKYVQIGLTYRYDSRDIIEYPMAGTFLRAYASKAGIGVGAVDHFRTTLDVRKYMPVTERLTIAGRALTTVAGGTRLPTYSHVFIGYEEKIRGHYADVYEGENLFLSSVEARFRLLGPRYIQWTSAVAPEFSVLRYGINAAVFADLGATWFRRDVIRSVKPLKGFGAGVHVLLPYSGVLRLEYAFNESFDGQLIVDLLVLF